MEAVAIERGTKLRSSAMQACANSRRAKPCAASAAMRLWSAVEAGVGVEGIARRGGSSLEYRPWPNRRTSGRCAESGAAARSAATTYNGAHHAHGRDIALGRRDSRGTME